MNYGVGDKVVHWTHGVGTVVAIDQIVLAGITRQYYVVKINQLKVWVPIKPGNTGSIRPPTKKTHFRALFKILGTPGEKLPDNQYRRRNELRQRMEKRTLEDLCHLIRDLTDWSRQHTLNQFDSSILFRAEENLLDEWVLSLSADRNDALNDLEKLMGISLTNLIR